MRGAGRDAGGPERADKRRNFEICISLFNAATNRLTFTAGRSKPEQPLSSIEAQTGTVSAADAIQTLGGLRWHHDYRAEVITPTLRFYALPVEAVAQCASAP